MQISENPVYVAYARSLIWIGLLIAIAISVTIIVSLIFTDFIHGNPHRTQTNALVMMVVFPPIFAVVALIGVFLVFGITQSFQAVIADALMKRFGRRSQFAIVLALPITTVLAWYCYDYLPDFSYFGGAPDEWRPYERGLSTTRYLLMLLAQSLVTLFSLFYCDATLRHASRKWVVVTAIVIAVAGGAVRGHFMAEDQYKVLHKGPTEDE
jgi:hypothetical protein